MNYVNIFLENIPWMLVGCVGGWYARKINKTAWRLELVRSWANPKYFNCVHQMEECLLEASRRAEKVDRRLRELEVELRLRAPDSTAGTFVDL